MAFVQCCNYVMKCSHLLSQQLGIGRGALVMSNVFLSSSLIYLASDAAGCVDENSKVVDNCESSVYGMRPAALIANIAIFSGVLSALLMPFAGALVDYTPYRRRIGIVVASLMILIQAVQIGTVSQTWFAMSVLQGIAGFLYQVQVLATYAYLPEIARAVGESTMTHCKHSNMLNFIPVKMLSCQIPTQRS